MKIEEKEFHRRIGKAIRQKRRIANTTIEEVSKVLGVSYQQITKYEKGVDRIPLFRLIKLCGLLKIDLIKLVNFATYGLTE